MEGPQNIPPELGKYRRVIGSAQTIIITPIIDIPFCVEILFLPENSKNCVNTAPTVPPLPVMPEITPSDLKIN